jgi:hypothetical protein
MITAQEALRQCVEAMKLVDFKNCAESDELWHKLNAAQQVAEEALKRPEQEPVAWAVTFDGEITGNIFDYKEKAERTMMNLNSSHPSFERAILPLYAAPPTSAPVATQQTFAKRDKYDHANFQRYSVQMGYHDFELSQDSDDDYRNPNTQLRWNFWRASRDALGVAAPLVPTAMSQVFKGADGLRKLAEHNAFWESQPYGTRLYFGDGLTEYLHRDVLRAAVSDLEAQAAAIKMARAALNTADYVIKGREHTGFIHNAIAVIDAATKE